MSLCVTVGGTALAPIVTSGDPTSTSSPWSEAYVRGLNGLADVSCAQEGLCLATSYGGNGSDGNVIASPEPGAGAEAWVEGNVYGTPLMPPDPIVELGAEELSGVSCVPDGLCVVADVHGQLMVGIRSLIEPGVGAPPVASGAPAPGQTLSCEHGSWTGYPAPSVVYQWLRGGEPIAGADASAYLVQASDAGYGLACQVTASNSAGSGAAVSNTLPASRAGGRH